MNIVAIDAVTGAPVNIKADSLALWVSIMNDYRGIPQDRYSPQTGVIGGADNAVIYDSFDVSMFNFHIVECIAGTVDLLPAFDGVNFTGAQPRLLLMDSDPVAAGAWSLTVASGKIAAFPFKIKRFQILQNGGVASNAKIIHMYKG